MISKFEGDLSPGLRELGFSFKIADATRSWKPFDFMLGMPIEHPTLGIILRFFGIEGKTAKGNGFYFPGLWYEHQRNALNTMMAMSKDAPWVAIHYKDLKEPAFLLPWYVYLVIEGQYKTSIPRDVWDSKWNLVWEHEPRRQKNYWRIPPEHPIRS